MDDWPTHHQELSRKTLQELQKWTDRYENREIDARTWANVLSVLYDTTSGLIDDDISSLIVNLHREAQIDVNFQAP